MNRHEAAFLLAEHGAFDPRQILSDPDVRKRAYRTAARKLHPDNAQTGNAKQFLRVKEAFDVLEEPR